MSLKLERYVELIDQNVDDQLKAQYCKVIINKTSQLNETNVHLRYSYFRDICDPKNLLEAQKVAEAVFQLASPYLKVLEMRYEALNYNHEYEEITAVLVSEMILEGKYFNPITGEELDKSKFDNQIRAYFLPTTSFLEDVKHV